MPLSYLSISTLLNIVIDLNIFGANLHKMAHSYYFYVSFSKNGRYKYIIITLALDPYIVVSTKLYRNYFAAKISILR